MSANEHKGKIIAVTRGEKGCFCVKTNATTNKNKASVSSTNQKGPTATTAATAAFLTAFVFNRVRAS